MKLFSKEILNDGIQLGPEENIHASLIGLAVDYLTRFMLGDSVDKAFHISSLGAEKNGMLHKAITLKAHISGLDNNSIIAACKLAGFDVCYRSSIRGYKPIEEINPDLLTIGNIRTMVDRSLSFWNKYGPVVHSNPTFEGGYTATIDSGDGDYVTQDTLWDFKVSKKAPTTQHSLQILIYYVMGLHSFHGYFKNITKLGFFNPRLNTVYTCSVSQIPQETIDEIENKIICYGVQTFSEKPKYPSDQQVSLENVFSVSDICQATRQKKSAVYADIHSGKLSADKKGNKYIISEYEFYRYVDYIKTRQKIMLITMAIVVALAFLLLIFRKSY